MPRCVSLQMCPVCLEEFESAEKLAVCPCHHGFHVKWVLFTLLSCTDTAHCSNGRGLCGQHLSHFVQMGVAYVDSTWHTWLKWVWLMWTALVTHGSNGHGLCGLHFSHMAQMGVAYMDSTCHTWLKWAWLMRTALVTHYSNGRGLCGQHLAEEQTNMAVPFCCINSDWPATCTSLQMEIFGHFLHFQTSSCIRWRSLFIG